MKIYTEHTKTMKSFADSVEVSKQYIHKLIKDGKFNAKYPGHEIVYIERVPYIYTPPKK